MGKSSAKAHRKVGKSKKGGTKKEAASDDKASAASGELAAPKEGWIEELKSAQKDAKANQTSAQAQLRVAVAASSVRQWKKTKAACGVGLAFCNDDDIADDNDETKQKLLHYQQLANQELALAAENSRNRKGLKDLFDAVRRDDVAIDNCNVQHITFSNLNILHYACMIGDIYLLEEAVALGAAIDYPVLDEEELKKKHAEEGGVRLVPPAGRPGPFPAQRGTTALVLLCAALASYGKVGNAPGLLTPELKKTLQANEDCAIYLVKLGADCTKKLPRPDNASRTSSSPFDPDFLNRRFNLHGKTAKELAKISGKRNLIAAIEEFEKKEDKIAKAFCRCGSRLPWLQCHSGEILGESPYYLDRDDGLFFRYSPLALCPCKLTKKLHYKCCWHATARPVYQNDSTGELTGDEVIQMGNNPLANACFTRMAELKQEMIDNGEDLNQPMFPPAAKKTPDEHRSSTAELIRSLGSLALVGDVNSKSKIGSWDPEVYAGCVERIDNYFMWTDIHWRLDEPELLTRVKEWNDALELYCNDKGLMGAEREAVLKKHTANPCAPCANPSCEAFEQKVKEFKRCARCKKVSYCTADCQASAWKQHKKECIPVGLYPHSFADHYNFDS